MGIKKIIKYLILVILGLLIGKIIIQELFDNRPFKFEKYKTSEQLEETARLRFLVGSDLNQIRSDLEKSGAKCRTHKPSDKPINYKFVLYCEYNTSLLSLHPFERYKIVVVGDDDYKLIELDTQLVSGLWMYIP